MVKLFHGILYSNKKNKILNYAILGIDLKNIMIGKNILMLKDTWCVIPYIQQSQTDRTIEMRTDLYLPKL